MSAIIKVSQLTKSYGPKRGIFNLDFEIKRGETVALIGHNGSGKTTLMRHLIGFVKQDSGICQIDNFNCWTDTIQIQKKLGYLSGEVNLPNYNGLKFIKMSANYRGIELDYANQLLDIFELDPDVNMKKMSKGMKQKLALVIALMHDSEILILDEPTSGFDPISKFRFVELIKKEKRRNKTILICSHDLDEVKEIADRVLILKQGQLINFDFVNKEGITLEDIINSFEGLI